MTPPPKADPPRRGRGSASGSGARLRAADERRSEMRAVLDAHERRIAALEKKRDDPVERELRWINKELEKPIVLPSPNALYRRARLRYHRARLEKLL
jgi:hypothetical protein